ncbi:hypothetical protein Acr_24g0005490 [Actinidia rufa]|uniref:Uncharacterized protein n=1 Tax=Actinidia rufa TaxID=165716 RepID=A0A7J0GU49_9ERIC|nr:hypothetical protein Acr_24g0005490 [Actinidia rufa]
MDEVMYEFHRIAGMDGMVVPVLGVNANLLARVLHQLNICMKKWGMASVNGISPAKHTCEIGGHIEDREMRSISKFMDISKGIEGTKPHYAQSQPSHHCPPHPPLPPTFHNHHKTSHHHCCGKKLGRATNSQYCSVSSALDLGCLKGDLHRRTKVNGRGEATQNPSGVEIRPRILVDMESLEMGIPSILPRPRARRRQHFGSERSDEYSEGGYGELNGDDLARSHGLVLPRSRGFGDLKFGVLNAEMGLRRMDV